MENETTFDREIMRRLLGLIDQGRVEAVVRPSPDIIIVSEGADYWYERAGHIYIKEISLRYLTWIISQLANEHALKGYKQGLKDAPASMPWEKPAKSKRKRRKKK